MEGGQRMSTSTMTPLKLRLWPDMEQRSEAWFRARAGRPTASQFHRIITPAGKDSAGWADYATELIAEALQPEHISAEFYGNRHTERGEQLEPEALAWAEEQMPGLRIEQAGFVTRDDETIGCSPDGLLVDANGEYVAGIEVKSPLAKNHGKYLLANEVPGKYKPQVHGSMAVTGLRWWYFVSYSTRLRPMILRVEWDSYTDKVSDALDRFLDYYRQRVAEDAPRLRREVA